MQKREEAKKNNKKVRLDNYLKSMRKEFGPDVQLYGDRAVRLDNEGNITQTLGNFNDFIKGGGKLEGTPRDTRSKLSIEKAKEQEADKNFDFEKASSVLDTGSNRSEISIADFTPSKEESMKSTMNEIDNIMAAPESLDDILKKSLTGTDEATAGATNSTMADQLRETSGRLEQLKILQDADVKTGPPGMIKTDKGFASVKTAQGNQALKKQLAKLKAKKLAQIRIGG